jgi:hypothetical protein
MPDDKDSKNEKVDNSISKTIEVSDSSSLVISRSLWKNQERLDIRIYLKTDNYTGPTKKGINVPFEKLDEIISILKELQQ